MQSVKAFAHFCRTGEGEVRGVKQEVLELYRNRALKVVSKNLQREFPLARRDLTDREWSQLVEDFVRDHAIKAPQMWKIGLELFDYVSSSHYGEKLGRPYFNDLLWFEWVEIAVGFMEDLATPPGILSLNPAHEFSHLRYPVFRSFAKDLLHQEGDYFLLTYRHPNKLKVYFLEISPPMVLLLETIRAGARSLQEACEKIGLPFTEPLCEKVEELIKKKVLLI
ncbi:MAG: putative DNA-binding domain-containing protein [Verrucomicrobia bacterium]|nr:putative DNA-binding domain-containing protein [Verrucomicrobiota bacterium]